MITGSARRDVKDAIKKVIAGFPVDAVCCEGTTKYLVEPGIARRLTQDEEASRHIIDLYNLGENQGLSGSKLWIAIRTDCKILAMIIAAHEVGHQIYGRRHPILNHLQRIARKYGFGVGLIFEDEVQAWKIAEEVLRRKGLWMDIKDKFMEKKAKCLKTYERR